MRSRPVRPGRPVPAGPRAARLDRLRQPGRQQPRVRMVRRRPRPHRATCSTSQPTARDRAYDCVRDSTDGLHLEQQGRERVHREDREDRGADVRREACAADRRPRRLQPEPAPPGCSTRTSGCCRPPPSEDSAGGVYGGTVLRDLVALCPDLRVGTIEDGSDFTITALERFTRATIRSVVDEVAGYYGREWGVWEFGRFRLDIPRGGRSHSGSSTWPTCRCSSCAAPSTACTTQPMCCRRTRRPASRRRRQRPAPTSATRS